jgi:hypothetical protein
MHLNDVTVAENGCGEIEGELVNCFSGDNSNGLLVTDSAADWFIESSEFNHNTRGGIWIDVIKSSSFVEIARTRVEGNAGTQLAVLGNAEIVNTIIAGNCDYFSTSSFAGSVESCRYDDIAMLFSEREVTLVNNTVLGQGEALISFSPQMGTWGDDFVEEGLSPSIVAVNTIFSGIEGDLGLPSLLMPDMYAGYLEWSKNIFYQVLEVGAWELCDMTGFVSNMCDIDPLFISTDGTFGSEMDLNLTEGSPAIDAGLSVQGVPDVDFRNTPRPSGDAIDIGAIEYQFE